MYGSDLMMVVLAVALVINIIGAMLMAKAAEEKGYTDIHAMAICFWLGVFGYFYVLALPDKKLQTKLDTLNHLLEKQSSNGVMPTYQAPVKEEYVLPEL